MSNEPIIKKRDSKLAAKIEKWLRWMVIIYTIALWLAFLAKGIVNALNLTGETFIFYDHTLNVIVESYMRAIFPTIASFLTIKHSSAKYGHITPFRKFSLIALSVMNLGLLVIIPTIYSLFRGFNHITMPFPFIAAIYWIPYEGKIYSESFTALFGAAGIGYAFAVHAIMQFVIFVSVFLFGRRAFCSTLCVYAGPFAEAMGEGLPYPRSQNKTHTKIVNNSFRRVARILLVIDFGLSLPLAILGLVWLASGYTPLPIETLIEIETYRVLSLDTMLFGIGFLIWGGRFYCYYCPAGLSMGIVGRLGGQQIDTDLSNCIKCKQCNNVCKMSIDIMSHAIEKKPVKTWYCVGCDCCVMVCPTKNLAHSTRFTRILINKLKLKSKKDKI